MHNHETVNREKAKNFVPKLDTWYTDYIFSKGSEN